MADRLTTPIDQLLSPAALAGTPGPLRSLPLAQQSDQWVTDTGRRMVGLFRANQGQPHADHLTWRNDLDILEAEASVRALRFVWVAQAVEVR